MYRFHYDSIVVMRTLHETIMHILEAPVVPKKVSGVSRKKKLPHQNLGEKTSAK